MTISEWPAAPSIQAQHLAEQLAASENYNEMLEEALTDLELSAEDIGWRKLGAQLEQEFTRSGLTSLIGNCRLMAVAAPLVKRGLMLRIGYVWGQGVQVQCRDAEVNAVVQAFWDDESNQQSFSSSQAQEENERTLGTDGNVVFAFFPDAMTGRVQIRVTPFEEITDKICNPEDRDDPWFYIREYDTTVIRPFVTATGLRTTRSRPARVKKLHPALGYRPATRPRSIDGIEVEWDVPLLHVAVNKPTRSAKWGVPDAYAALPWARAYDGFLTDWAKLVKSLSRFAWRLTGDKASKARRAAEALGAALPTSGTSAEAGATAAYGPGAQLEAIPKSGATIDSASGKPLAAMVAAAMGVSVVDLLADPGTTGARAVAETLDKPIILEMTMRRALWASVIETVASYVVDQAVKAPRGPLKGTVVRDQQTGREMITLAGDMERTVDVTFPPLDELDPVQLVGAIVDADATRKVPPEVIARLLMQALGVKDIDEILEDLLDADGNWLGDPGGSDATAGGAAVDAFRRGEDPVTATD